MENSSESKLPVQTYLLQQGQSINKLHGMLNNSLVLGYFKRGVSIVIEVFLFFLFLLLLAASVFVPTNPIQFTRNVTHNTSLVGGIQNDDLFVLMLFIKGLVFIASLLPLALMIIFRRNRKKSALIQLAFSEVKGMKTLFDKSIYELKF